MENKEVVLRFNKEFIENGDEAVLDELVSTDFVNHTIPYSYPSNVTGLKQFAALLRKGFPDLKVTIHQQVAEGDLVCTLKTLEGTHLGEIMGRLPTGKKVTMTVIDMVRVRDGKYVDHWAKNDVMQTILSL